MSNSGNAVTSDPWMMTIYLWPVPVTYSTSYWTKMKKKCSTIMNTRWNFNNDVGMSIAFRLANMTPKFFNTLFVIYGSGTSSWKPWRWERLNLIFTIKDRSWSKIDRDFVTFLPYLPLGLIQCTILRLPHYSNYR